MAYQRTQVHQKSWQKFVALAKEREITGGTPGLACAISAGKKMVLDQKPPLQREQVVGSSHTKNVYTRQCRFIPAFCRSKRAFFIFLQILHFIYANN